MTVLALETSCDETAVAILRGRNGQSGSELLASEIASQIAEHGKYGGIVPEIASRNHLVQAPRLLERAARNGKIDMSNIDAFAATSGPGLASSLMIGASIVKGLAVGFGKPYLSINHLEGHLLSPFFSGGEVKPNVSLIVSGGHTMLIRVHGLAGYELVGRTVDDAAGEAFDKVAKMLGLGYPGGPEIEKRARDRDPARFDLPRSMLDSENFSFSGLKTAVRYLLPKLHGDFLPDLCASFQQAIVDILVRKTIAAARKYDADLVTVSGGVSCNQELRRELGAACTRKGFEFKSAEPWLCTDNAAMIAFAGSLRLQVGFESKVTEEIDPNLALA
ncbi:MAG TPA: tRNA (adenosine(37)-N6)-threonylcarbamoyltransferase complex transferase subunit TsaD [Candidatus Dormibacteraeota bacterium]|nr:tRNA (adenosine(37)-N6)-threonylcarbamoyltransferase complex transferase subunit TsaD [Candidatus Dormibacteraeota bacterium]